MHKCVEICVNCVLSEAKAVRQELEQYARTLGLEGMMRCKEDGVCDIIIAGAKDHIDMFIERIAQYVHENRVREFEVEAAFKDRDYRGVFRSIE